MIEQLIQEYEKIQKDFIEAYSDDSKFYKERKTNADNTILQLEQIRDNNSNTPLMKYIAGYLAANEISIMHIYSSMQLHAVYSIMLNNDIDAVLKTLDSVLEQMSKSPTQHLDETTVSKIQKDLADLQKVNANNQEYIDMLKIGMEKKNKWLNENR
jgi:hypothetical protein